MVECPAMNVRQLGCEKKKIATKIGAPGGADYSSVVVESSVRHRSCEEALCPAVAACASLRDHG